MGRISRQIFILLAICPFIHVLESSPITYPEPARCNTDKDCLAGQAKCIRRECHCIENLAFGDGKTKCEPWIECPFEKDPCKKKTKNSHCVRKPGTKMVACRCDSEYFGRPQLPSCLKGSGADAHGRHPCLTDSNCPRYSKCVEKRCTCRYELTGNGETCKAAPPMSCSKEDDCHADKGKCVAGACQCDGFYVGNGVHCRDAKPCSKNTKCKSHAVCMIDPLFPKIPICKCDVGFKKAKKGKCVECLNNTDCNKVYATCYKGICKCKDELVKDEKTCKPAPLHECKNDQECDARAKCYDGKCYCQGNTTGNGKYCRESLACPQEYQCGSRGTCLVDPLLPKNPKCRCKKGHSFAKDGKCVECLGDKNCAKYSTCYNGVCECKDELIKEGETCKPAPLHLCDEEHKCHEKAECLYGKCYCQGNLTGNGIFCRDSLPCPDDHQCESNSVCVVDPLFPKSPNCKCLPGFKKSSDAKCEEVTECFKKGLLCPNGTTCTKAENESYDCTCNKGFQMAHGLNYTCEDIDECKHANICVANSHCTNKEGSYKCVCKTGFKVSDTGKCVGSAPQSNHHHPSPSSQSETNLSRSYRVTSHVILLVMAVLYHQAFAS